MTAKLPEPGSVWARRFPDAYPHEWYVQQKLESLPTGFTRLATREEADLITGRISEEEYARRDARPASSPSDGGEGGGRSVRPSRSRKPRASQRESVAKRFKDLSEFVRQTHAELTPSERSVWLAVFNFTKGGIATVTQATMAKIANANVRSIKRAVAGLVRRGLLEIVEQGRPGRSSVYRYRPKAY